MEKKRKRKRRIKITAAIIAVGIVIGFVALYLTNGPNYFGPGPIEITISPDKPYFLQGETINFTVTIINNQSWPITHPVQESVKIIKNGTTHENYDMHADYPPRIPTYPANTNSTAQWTWIKSIKEINPTPLDVGNYTFNYKISGIGYVASANCTFEIK